MCITVALEGELCDMAMKEMREAISIALLLLFIGACRTPPKLTVEGQPISAPSQSIVLEEEMQEEAQKETWLRETPSEEELGVPIYPGAKAVKGGTFEMFIPSQLRGYKRRYSQAIFESNDSYGRVLVWYLAMLKGRNPSFDEFKASNGMNAILRLESESEKWIISIQQLEGRHGTLILIKHIWQ